MKDIFSTAAELQLFCDSNGWQSCFIGGVAVLRWGEVRVTRDVDLTLLTGFGEEDRFIQPLLQRYKPRLKDAEQFARRNRVVLLESPDGVGIDISLAALPFEENAVNRASVFRPSAEHAEIRTCSAEDLIVLKLFASRPLDIRDAEGIALRNANNLDWDLIEKELAPLAEAKEDPTIMQTLTRLRETENSTS